MLNAQRPADFPIWPSGIARFADGILEVTTGEGIPVAAADIIEIGVEPPRAGRSSLTLAYRAGLMKTKRSYSRGLRSFVGSARPRHDQVKRRYAFGPFGPPPASVIRNRCAPIPDSSQASAQ